MLELAFLGGVEPHAYMLKQPDDGQLLYKIMAIENLLRSIQDSYLHFNRVDSYVDFPGADLQDGQQLPADRIGNAMTTFKAAPEFSAANYYDQCRHRTYASCFSVENSEFIWKNYANGGAHGKVCLVFEFGKLRAMLNETLRPENSALLYQGVQCHQIFSINYGMIDYIDWARHQENERKLPNPMTYIYLKDERFSAEREFRISLSALGIGHFVLDNGREIDFPKGIGFAFDFHRANDMGVIRELLCVQDHEHEFLVSELLKLGIQSRFQ